MRTLRRGLIAFTLAAALPRVAGAGGFDIPDIGAEALGRGGTFVAKADSPLAMYYNVAGMARQRGTRLTLDVNLLSANQSFTRAGSYAGDPTDPRTPWAGQPYPTVSNQTPFNFQPFLGLTTDFDYFKRWTFGIGVLAPPGVGNRQFGDYVNHSITLNDGTVRQTPRFESPLTSGSGVNNWSSGSTLTAPTPSRYDTGITNVLIIMPTLAAAFSPSKYLDLGAAVHWVVGQAQITKATFNPLGPSTCGAQNQITDCDAYSTINTVASTIGFTFSAMGHPTDWLDLGLTYRPQITAVSTGTGTPAVSQNGGAIVAPFPATLTIQLPHIIRWGVRLVSHYNDGTERGDFEVDGTWENWSAQPWTTLRSCGFELGKPPSESDPVYPCDPGNPANTGRLAVDSPGQMKDTVSVRIGGAYNLRLSDLTRLIFRAGGYYDSPTNDIQWTNLGVYSAAKYALTAGLGYKYKGFTVNLAYASIFMPDRTVTNSQIRAASATNGTDYVQGVDPVLIVGNGVYTGHIDTVSIGLSWNFSEFGRGSLFPH